MFITIDEFSDKGEAPRRKNEYEAKFAKIDL